MGAVNGATHISLLWNYNGIDSMADTYLQIYLHIVFAVQGRQNLLHGAHREEVNKYITGIVTNNGQKLLAVGGMPDHTHVLVGINRAVNFADLVRDIKANSSRFINEQRWLRGHFRWQEGYGGFSYSRSQLHEVIHYILKQEEHHRKRTFKEEYTALLKKFEVEYDERYLFEWIDID